MTLYVEVNLPQPAQSALFFLDLRQFRLALAADSFRFQRVVNEWIFAENEMKIRLKIAGNNSKIQFKFWRVFYIF